MTKAKEKDKPITFIVKAKNFWNKNKTNILIAVVVGVIVSLMVGYYFLWRAEVVDNQKSNKKAQDEKIQFKENILREIADNCICVQLYYASMGGLNTTKEVPWRPLRKLKTEFYRNNVGRINLIEDEDTKKAIYNVYEWFQAVSQRTDHLIEDEKWSNFTKIQNIKNDVEFLKEYGNKNRSVYKETVDRCNATIKVIVDELRNERTLIVMFYNVPLYKSDWYKEDVLLKTMEGIAGNKDLPSATGSVTRVKQRWYNKIRQ